MTTMTVQVPAIHCGHCVHTIQSELSEIPGVSRVQAASDTQQVSVEFAPPATEAIIRSRLVEINYPPVN